MNCKTCKYWITDPEGRRYDDQSAMRIGLGVCGIVELFFDCTRWNEEGKARELIDPTRLAYVQDSSDYIASLYTAPEFGCVQYEAARDDNDSHCAGPSTANRPCE